MAGLNAPLMGKNFQFISISSPEDAKDRSTRRLAKSHAVARGLEKRRKRLQQSGDNFYAVSFTKDIADRSTETNFGPFQMLAGESPRLQALLSQHSCPNPEPLLSVSDELVLQNFQSVLRKGLNDRALLSAFMSTHIEMHSHSAGSVNREYFMYQNEAFSYLRENLSSLDEAILESTLGAILLLAGTEARIGMPRSVQLHMGAIKQLLDFCQRKDIHLGDAIKRAIFWQDLNCSVMTGSTRVVNHTTFSELKWTRQPFSSSHFVLPTGFKPLSRLLGEEFVEILKDVYALQCIRDKLWRAEENVISMADIDNQQASIQSRIANLPGHSPFSECCHLALYLCSTMLRCKIWRTSVIPSHLSLQLLRKLQQAQDDHIWDNHPGLLAWMLYLAGAFAPVGPIRVDYIALLRKNRETRLKELDKSWLQLLEVLKRFIWSGNAFKSQVEAFWKETCA